MANVDTRKTDSVSSSIVELLDKETPFTPRSEQLFTSLGSQLPLPDGGKNVREIAGAAPGGAFDPRDLEKLPAESIGYRARWSVITFPYYGLDWDITGLRLESLHPQARELPWLVIVNGGSANMYEFFTDPLNAPGFAQYLAQAMNVLVVTIPGNFKYGGWTLPVSQRVPQYLLDRDIAPAEIDLRNAIYTNRMEMEGLKRLIARETSGDILITGHSTSGELAFLAMDEPELAARLKARFLGWGSGGPASLRRAWEDSVTSGKAGPVKRSEIPPLSELRTRYANEYVKDGYIGPLNPCGGAEMTDQMVAERWMSAIDRNRPNIKQVMQDLEHRGIAELQPELEQEIKKLAHASNSDVDLQQVANDLFATTKSPTTGYRKMVWMVGKWDKKHWHKTTPAQAQELTMANEFRKRNPLAAIRVMVFDLPLTHYGHIERPSLVAAGFLGAVSWLVKT